MTAALFLFLSAVPASAQTDVKDRAEYRKLLGTHKLSLQWVSWEKFGKVTIAEERGMLKVHGRQELNGDYVQIDGTIVSVERNRFVFEGVITTRVSYNNNGEPCHRRGDFDFAAKGKRRYWRMQQIENPCEEIADYVDIYFR
jgi:hypothetical protein